MANDINMVVMTGRLGDAADVRMDDERGSVRFAIASNRYIPQGSDNGAEVEFAQETNWARVICWGNVARAAAQLHLKRGDQVLIEGRWHSQDVAGRGWHQPQQRRGCCQPDSSVAAGRARGGDDRQHRW